MPDRPLPSCPTAYDRHARPDRASLKSWNIRKKGAPKRSLKPEGRKKTTLSGTYPDRNPRRIPSSPEVRTGFHDLARLITRMRFHPNKDGHSDFCLKLHAGFRSAVSSHVKNTNTCETQSGGLKTTSPLALFLFQIRKGISLGLRCL